MTSKKLWMTTVKRALKVKRIREEGGKRNPSDSLLFKCRDENPYGHVQNDAAWRKVLIH